VILTPWTSFPLFGGNASESRLDTGPLCPYLPEMHKFPLEQAFDFFDWEGGGGSLFLRAPRPPPLFEKRACVWNLSRSHISNPSKMLPFMLPATRGSSFQTPRALKISPLLVAVEQPIFSRYFVLGRCRHLSLFLEIVDLFSSIVTAAALPSPPDRKFDEILFLNGTEACPFLLSVT